MKTINAAAIVAAIGLSLGATVLTAGAAQADTAPLAGGVSIDVGGNGDAASGFVADEFGTGGVNDTEPAGTLSDPNFPSTVPHPIPNDVWQTSKFTESSYDVTGLTPGTTYQLRLYFMDWFFQKTGQREFNVVVNGTQVLTNFDITAAAVAKGADGQESFGVEQDFDATADSTGAVTIDFTRGAVNQPQINAIALVPETS